jgi:anti-sigma regulatory factor (Ser/Thr protein kinase)
MATFEIQRTATELSTLRNCVRLLPALTDLDHSITDDLVLVVSELASNAIAAARPASTITVEVERVADEIRICVENVGPPLDHVPRSLPTSDALRGRGLAIVCLLSTAVHADHRHGRTRVLAVRDLTQER